MYGIYRKLIFKTEPNRRLSVSESLDLLFKGVEFRCRKEFAKGDFKAVTKLFDGYDAGILTFTVEDT